MGGLQNCGAASISAPGAACAHKRPRVGCHAAWHRAARRDSPDAARSSSGTARCHVGLQAASAVHRWYQHRQLRYAERQLQHYREQLKLVLVSGSPLTFRLQGLPAYFDQHGALARRIGIERVPSVVYTRDGRLLIEEVVTDE